MCFKGATKRGVQTFSINGVGGQFRLVDINNTMNIERDLFSSGAPMLITKAVRVFSVSVSGEGMVTSRDGPLIDFIVAAGV